jgi:DNA-binding transcriptional MerR regulator
MPLHQSSLPLPRRGKPGWERTPGVLGKANPGFSRPHRICLRSLQITVTLSIVSSLLSIEQLAGKVTAWCDKHGVVPANGQVATDTQPRTLRYYRTLGLMDPPAAGGGFAERHYLQACAVRVLQAQGLPLARIHSLIFGRSDAELLSMLQATESKTPPELPSSPQTPATAPLQTVPLGPDFLLVSRRPHLRLSDSQIRQILHILHTPDSP